MMGRGAGIWAACVAAAMGPCDGPAAGAEDAAARWCCMALVLGRLGLPAPLHPAPPGRCSPALYRLLGLARGQALGQTALVYSATFLFQAARSLVLGQLLPVGAAARRGGDAATPGRYMLFLLARPRCGSVLTCWLLGIGDWPGFGMAGPGGCPRS